MSPPSLAFIMVGGREGTSSLLRLRSFLEKAPQTPQDTPSTPQLWIPPSGLALTLQNYVRPGPCQAGTSAHTKQAPKVAGEA